MSLTPPPSPADRFAGIIAMLIAMVGARLERPGRPGLAGPLTLAIAVRLTGIRNRLVRYVQRMAAGTLTLPHRRPATPRRRTDPARPAKWAHLPKLPRGRLWLVRLVPGSGVGANHLRILLDDPDMVALLQAAPQAGRMLRPLWHMLSSQPLPPILRRPRPAPAPSAPAPSAPAPSAPAPPAQPTQAEAGATPRPAESGPAPSPPAPRSEPPARAPQVARLAPVPPGLRTA